MQHGTLVTADPYQCGSMTPGALLVLGWQFQQWRLMATLIPLNGDQPGDIESRAREFCASLPTTRTIVSKVL